MHGNRFHVCADHGLHSFGCLHRPTFGLDHSQVTIVVTDATDQTFLHGCGVIEKALQQRLVRQVSQYAILHVRNDHRLIGGQTNFSRAVSFGQRRNSLQIIGVNPPDGNFEPDIVQPCLLLPVNAHVFVYRHFPRIYSRARQLPPNFTLDFLTKSFFTPLLQQKSQPGRVPRVPTAMITEHPKDRPSHCHNLHRSDKYI